MKWHKIPVIGRAYRKHRILVLVDEMAEHEQAMRDIGAQLLELSDPNDDLAEAVERLLLALEG
jgi:hypothetical protein